MTVSLSSFFASSWCYIPPLCFSRARPVVFRWPWGYVQVRSARLLMAEICSLFLWLLLRISFPEMSSWTSCNWQHFQSAAVAFSQCSICQLFHLLFVVVVRKLVQCSAVECERQRLSEFIQTWFSLATGTNRSHSNSFANSLWLPIESQTVSYSTYSNYCAMLLLYKKARSIQHIPLLKRLSQVALKWTRVTSVALYSTKKRSDVSPSFSNELQLAY